MGYRAHAANVAALAGALLCVLLLGMHQALALAPGRSIDDGPLLRTQPSIPQVPVVTATPTAAGSEALLAPRVGARAATSTGPVAACTLSAGGATLYVDPGFLGRCRT